MACAGRIFLLCLLAVSSSVAEDLCSKLDSDWKQMRDHIMELSSNEDKVNQLESKVAALEKAVEELLGSTIPAVATSGSGVSMTTQLPSVTSAPVTTNVSILLNGKYNLAEVLHKSILFYEAQRSGKLPDNNRIPWRGDSALGDKGNNNEDLVGGWYDAGDSLKLSFPMASAVTLLAWGLVEYRDAYVATGELDNMLDSIRWPLDYFIKSHVAPHELYGQIGLSTTHNSFWGRVEGMNTDRSAFKIDEQKPGTELAAETAAAMAASSMAFRPTDPVYADKLVSHAKQLYEFADKYRGVYSESIADAANSYASSWNSIKDELAWAAMWLYRATDDYGYVTKAKENLYTWTPWELSWADKMAGAVLMYYKFTTDSDKANYAGYVKNFLKDWFPGGTVAQTPKGLAWRLEWAPLRYSANVAFLALVAADYGILPTESRTFAKKQIGYMLGDTGRSFVVGFGVNPPVRCHHMGASCPIDKPCGWDYLNTADPNPNVLYGALVGGPDKNDVYVDTRTNYKTNEVSCDYNSGFQSAIAGLIHLEI